jgi:hypothetical protein
VATRRQSCGRHGPPAVRITRAIPASTTRRPAAGRLQARAASSFRRWRSAPPQVRRWKDETMVKRRVPAGMLSAERGFLRLGGNKDMPPRRHLPRHI